MADSTVPKADTPPPADNSKTLLLQSDENLYVRPTAGNNAAPGGSSLGPGATAPDAPASSEPDNHPYAVNWSGEPPSVGGTQVGADIGIGTTIMAGQPDATGAPASAISGGGTVGDSGPQQAGPGPTPGDPSGDPL